MVRKYRRITVILLTLSVLFWATAARSNLSEDMMSEILSGRSSDANNDDEHDSSTIADAANPGDPKNTSVTIIKKELPLTPQDQAIIYYNKGIEALNNHQEIEATTFFKKSLTEYPKHHKSRMQLIQLYQKVGWTDEIEKLLIAGLDLEPEHSDFIKNLAMLYQQKGQMRKSLSILLSMPDPFSKQPDYLALLALAYLNANQADMAEKYYQQLLMFNKENSIWWLGLAVAQDANGYYKEALNSFNQAKTLGRFNTEILDYIYNKTEDIKQYE